MKHVSFVVDDKRNILFRIMRENIAPIFNIKGVNMDDVDIIIEDTGFEIKSDGSDVTLQHRQDVGNANTQLRLNFSFRRADNNAISLVNKDIFKEKYIRLSERVFNYEVSVNVDISTTSRTIIERYKDAMVDYMDKGFEQINFKPKVQYAIPTDLYNLLKDISNKAGYEFKNFINNNGNDIVKIGSDIEQQNETVIIDYEHFNVVIVGDRLANGDISNKDKRYSYTASIQFNMYLPISISTEFEIVVNNNLVDTQFILENDIYSDSVRSMDMRDKLLTSPYVDEVKFELEDRRPLLSVLYTVDEGEASLTFLTDVIDDNFVGIDKQLLLQNKEQLFDVIGEAIKEQVEQGVFTIENLVSYLNSVVNGPVIEDIKTKLNINDIEAKYTAYIGGFSIVMDTFTYNMNFLTSLPLSNENVELILRLLNSDAGSSTFVEYLVNYDATMDNYVDIINTLKEKYDLNKPLYDLKLEIIYKEFIYNKNLTYIDQIFVSPLPNYICNLKYLPDISISHAFAGYLTENNESQESDQDVEAIIWKRVINDEQLNGDVIIDKDLNVYGKTPDDKTNTNRVMFFLLKNIDYAKKEQQKSLARWKLMDYEERDDQVKYVQILTLIAEEREVKDGND